jgi:hypothetical protein
MLYNGVKEIIDRDLNIAMSTSIIDSYCSYLREVVNLSSEVFARCINSVDNSEGDCHAPFMLYYHIIQMIDGIEVLVSQSCFAAAVPLVRSLFEAFLSLEYIFEDDSKARSLAWVAFHFFKKMRLYESFDFSTEIGKRLKIAVENDSLINTDFIEKHKDNAKKGEQFYRRTLSNSRFQQFVGKMSTGKNIGNWYNLCGRLNSLKDLAYHLNRGAFYEVLYQDWSSVAHAYNFSRFIASEKDKSISFYGIRSNAYYAEIPNMVSSFAFFATINMLRNFRPSEDYRMPFIKLWKQYPNACPAETKRMLGIK